MNGFKPLKDGCIHLRCYKCGRKQSNMPREPWDHPKAVLCEILCPKCSEGAMEPPSFYVDADDNELNEDPANWMESPR